MSEGLVASATHAGRVAPREGKVTGVVVGVVVNNVDLLCQARVQLRLPFLPGFKPWARVAVPMAGNDRGTFFMPQVDDEVLVMFEQGDVRAPFVIGSLWNRSDRPPAALSTDAITKFMVRTPLGHELELDDTLGTVKITSIANHEIKLGPKGIVVSTADSTASIELKADGSVAISGTSVEIKGTQGVTAKGAKLTLTGDQSTEISGGALCSVKATSITLN